jgi:hypothetical protein
MIYTGVICVVHAGSDYDTEADVEHAGTGPTQLTTHVHSISLPNVRIRYIKVRTLKTSLRTRLDFKMPLLRAGLLLTSWAVVCGVSAVNHSLSQFDVVVAFGDSWTDNVSRLRSSTRSSRSDSCIKETDPGS